MQIRKYISSQSYYFKKKSQIYTPFYQWTYFEENLICYLCTWLLYKDKLCVNFPRRFTYFDMKYCRDISNWIHFTFVHFNIWCLFLIKLKVIDWRQTLSNTQFHYIDLYSASKYFTDGLVIWFWESGHRKWSSKVSEMCIYISLILIFMNIIPDVEPISFLA